MEKTEKREGGRENGRGRNQRRSFRRNWRYITVDECKCKYHGTGVVFYSKGEVLFRCKFCASKVYNQVSEEEKGRWIEGKHPQGM